MTSLAVHPAAALAEAPAPPPHSLAHVGAGQHVTVARLRLPVDVTERIMELGVVPGTEVTVVRAGRRHLVVALRGFVLGLGRHEAAHIEVLGRPQVR